MRTTKIVSFSVPPKMEREIQKEAQKEHRTISEYLREAVRQYMARSDLEVTRKKISTRLKKKGISPQDVSKIIDELRWKLLAQESFSL